MVSPLCPYTSSMGIPATVKGRRDGLVWAPQSYSHRVTNPFLFFPRHLRLGSPLNVQMCIRSDILYSSLICNDASTVL